MFYLEQMFYIPLFFSACFFTISSTTEGSESVEMSPNWSDWFDAIFLRMRRMIFPDRVLGKPGTI